MTSLYCGERVSKDSVRVDACGTLDELSSFLGLSKSLIKERKDRLIIEDIQRDLFVMCAEIATKPEFLTRLGKKVNKSYVVNLEKIIAQLEKEKALKQSCFCLPGGNTVSGSLDVARTVCRRAERLTVKLKKKGTLLNDFILVYLNRLSDLCFLLARAYDKKQRKGVRI